MRRESLYCGGRCVYLRGEEERERWVGVYLASGAAVRNRRCACAEVSDAPPEGRGRERKGGRGYTGPRTACKEGSTKA